MLASQKFLRGSTDDSDQTYVVQLLSSREKKSFFGGYSCLRKFKNKGTNKSPVHGVIDFLIALLLVVGSIISI